MPTHDEISGAERKSQRTRSHHARADKESFPNIQGIKENVVGLAHDIRDASTDKAHDMADYVQDRMGDMKASGSHTAEKIEKRIKSKPGQSVAIAFVAGLLASFVFGRRSS